MIMSIYKNEEPFLKALGRIWIHWATIILLLRIQNGIPSMEKQCAHSSKNYPQSKIGEHACDPSTSEVEAG